MLDEKDKMRDKRERKNIVPRHFYTRNGIMITRKSIALEYWAKSILGLALIAVLLFVSAGLTDWRSAWVYLAIYAAAIVLMFFLVDPDLVAERIRRRHPNQKGWDKALLGLFGAIEGLLVPIVAGLNVRYRWPPDVNPWLQVVAMLVYILGWALHLWAMHANRYHAQVVRIQEDRGQTVITGGPYRWLRHPGYVGGILTSIFGPLMLGSIWATLVGLLGAVILIIRTSLEDKMLQDELAGYRDYAKNVRWRLIPGIW
jgi:protein-S-isoprenylcysteine O-methyltransferase Ste14